VHGTLTLLVAVREVASLAVGLSGPLSLTGRSELFFPVTVMVTFMVAPGWSRCGCSDDSLASFALRDDRSSVRAGDAVVSYGTVGTVALAAATRSAHLRSGPTRSLRSWRKLHARAASPR